MSDTVSVGLESVALALIFMPEPVTTFLGVALLGYARKRRVNHLKELGRSRPPTGLDAHYYYKVNKTNNDSVSYKIAPIKEGQLAKSLPKGVNLANQPVWQSYRNKALQYRAKRISPLIPTGQMPRTIRKVDGLIMKPHEWQAYRHQTLQKAIKKTPLVPTGQLPSRIYRSAGLINKPQEWQDYRRTPVSGNVGRTTKQFSGLQRVCCISRKSMFFARNYTVVAFVAGTGYC